MAGVRRYQRKRKKKLQRPVGLHRKNAIFSDRKNKEEKKEKRRIPAFWSSGHTLTAINGGDERLWRRRLGNRTPQTGTCRNGLGMVGWNQEKKRAEGHVMCGCYAAKKSGHGVCGTKSAARIGFEELLLQGSFANPTSLLGYVRQKKLLAFCPGEAK